MKHFFSLKVDHKCLLKQPTGTYWHQFVSFEKIDVCALLGEWHSAMPIVVNMKNLVFAMMPFMPRKCPIPPGKYYGYNISLNGWKEYNSQKYLSPSLMPNGIYRNVIKFRVNDELESGAIRMQFETYDASNAENVMT